MRRRVDRGVTATTHPIAMQHPPGEVHADGSDDARFRSEEPVVEQSNLHQVLAQRPGLHIVVVGLGDLSDPAVGRAVGRNVKVQGLHEEQWACQHAGLAGHDQGVGDRLAWRMIRSPFKISSLLYPPSVM